MIWLTRLRYSTQDILLDLSGYIVQPGGRLTGPFTWDRNTIIDLIHGGTKVYTARELPGYPGTFQQGAELQVIRLAQGAAFLRTVANGTERDNLGGLPTA